MEENNNVISAKFRRPTNIEVLLEDIKDLQPEILLSVFICEGDVSISCLGINNYEQCDSMIGKIERIKDYLMMMTFDEDDEYE